jgi:hypothetical protein
MRSRRIAALLAGIAPLGLAACGTQNAVDSAGKQAGQVQTQASKQLSPQADGLLQNAQGVAASVIATGRSYADAKISRKQALTRLDTAEQRARGIAKRANDLPATSRARSRLKSLTAQAANSAASLQDLISAGKGNAPGEVKGQLSPLQASAKQAYQQLKDGLPQSTQRQIQGTLDKISSLAD